MQLECSYRQIDVDRNLPVRGMLENDERGQELTFDELTYPGSDYDMRMLVHTLADGRTTDFLELWNADIDIAEFYRIDAQRALAAYFAQEATRQK